MRVLLLYPEYSYPRKNPPIGLASLAAWILQTGHDVRIIDLNVTPNGLDELANGADDWQPDLVGVSFMTVQYENAIKLILRIRGVWPDVFIVAGGPHASALPEELLARAPQLDAVVVGEGENALDRLLQSLQSGSASNLFSVPGLYFRETPGGNIQKSGISIEAVNFEAAPWPAWQLLALDKYRVASAGGDSSVPTFAVLSSRGCPGGCIFCDSHTIFGKRFRGRSAKNIFAEIMFLHKEYRMRRFDFVDDLITYDRDRVFEFCELIKQSGKTFEWSANARLDTVNEDMLLAMKQAGCVRVDFGVESGDPAVRKIIKKAISNERIVRIHNYCKSISMYVSTFLMVGNLGENMNSVRMTARLMKGLTFDASIAIACPYPGTELYKIAKDNGYLLTEDWTRYGTAPTFVTDYKPVMRTDKMSPEEILQAYYYLLSVFAWDKMRARYGRFFYFNADFIKQYIFSNKPYGGFVNKLRKTYMLATSFLSKR